jgi:hypothetical protein
MVTGWKCSPSSGMLQDHPSVQSSASFACPNRVTAWFSVRDRFRSSLATTPGWTPDNRIGLLLETPYHEMYTIPVSGKGHPGDSSRQTCRIPRWSPDGKRIFFRWQVAVWGLSRLTEER